MSCTVRQSAFGDTITCTIPADLDLSILRLEPDCIFRCLDCGFSVVNMHGGSGEFRAEEHARSGHRVGFFIDVADYPLDPMYMVEVQH